jgi:hypothetical protein
MDVWMLIVVFPSFSWPRELPSYETVEHCVSVFFDKIPTLPKMMHKPTFFANLQLPPSHPKFPVSLIPLVWPVFHIQADQPGRTSTRAHTVLPECPSWCDALAHICIIAGSAPSPRDPRYHRQPHLRGLTRISRVLPLRYTCRRHHSSRRTFRDAFHVQQVHGNV